MSFTDAISRVSEIQQQLSALTTPLRTQTGTTTATPFAAALAQAQSSGDIGADTTGVDADTTTGIDTGLASLSSPDTALSGGSATALSAGSATTLPAGSATTLPAGATSQLTSDQQQFASTLVADTGLNPSVVSAWLLAEENGGAATSRQAANNNDWLNIGYTGSGTDGADDAVWSDPVSAATATAGWLKGEASIPGYGTASSGVQAILSTVGQSPSAQISALQSSGWASSGYPDLPSLYSEVSA